MVINTTHKFIFVHIPKTAGRSITKSLLSLRGNRSRWLANTKHETIAELRANIGFRLSWKDRVLGRNPNRFLSFGFVRNPWDRIASCYRFLVERRPRPEIDTVACFKDFLVQAQNGVTWIQDLKSMRSQLDYFTMPDGRMSIDVLGHFEFLAEDTALIARRIKCPISLVHKNRSSNSGIDYRMSYDDEMIEIVATKFAEEIELFG